MSKSLLLLYSGDIERSRVSELAAAIGQLGSRVTVEDLASGDYDRILDAVVKADTPPVAVWTRQPSRSWAPANGFASNRAWSSLPPVG